jgi:Arc/MetJ-type ribon-helix-helix transcriptional regulator
MSISMSKELLIRIPEPLYARIKAVSGREYKSMSAFVRDALKERLDEMLTDEDRADIQAARKELQKGRTVAWRSIKRG